MPLSKQKDRERKRLSRLESKEVQPKQAEISELRGMMENISSGERWLYDNPEALASVMRGLEDARQGRVSEVDADGNIIPDF